MWYLYTLAYKDIEFYVGISKDPVSRFAQHKSGVNWGIGTTEHIYWIIEEGDYSHLKVNIITHFGKKEWAKTAEDALIKYFVSKGHKLCNIDGNIASNILITCRPMNSYKRRIKMPEHILKIKEEYSARIRATYSQENRFNAKLYENRRY